MTTAVTPRVDLSGRTFGHLVAVEAIVYPNRSASWVCRCDCGRTGIVRRTHVLLAGIGWSSRSCGCDRRHGSGCPNRTVADELAANAWTVALACGHTTTFRDVPSRAAPRPGDRILCLLDEARQTVVGVGRYAK